MNASGFPPFHHPPLQPNNECDVNFWPPILPPYQDEFGTFGPPLCLPNESRLSKGVLPNPAQSNTPNCKEPLNPPQLKGIAKMFYKTKLCMKFRSGTCSYGDNCTFAHGIEDLREPPPNWKSLITAHEEERGNLNWVDIQRITGMKFCRKFYCGERCSFGDRCTFLHFEPERVRESSVISVGTTPMEAGCRPNGRNHLEQIGLLALGGEASQKPSLRKTKMCIKWETTGYCSFGEKCHFAHGVAELQNTGGSDNEVENRNESRDPHHSTKSNGTSNKRHALPNQLVQPPLKRCPLDWRLPKKISNIYGDWIEEFGASKVES